LKNGKSTPHAFWTSDPVVKSAENVNVWHKNNTPTLDCKQNNVIIKTSGPLKTKLQTD